MSEGFHAIAVHKVVRETADAVTLHLDIPVSLTETFAYTAGQYLTFEAEINGEKVRRSYSLCTYGPADRHPAVTIKKVDNGRMSTYMNTAVKEGDVLQVMAPMGKFTVIPDAAKSTHYVLFAGGSGITPMMGISKAVLMHEAGSKVTLVYANRNADSVIFKQALADMEKQHSGRFKVIHSYDQAALTWFGMKGHLTEDKVVNVLQSKIGGSYADYQYYICGPGPMMDVVKKGLSKAGVAASHVFTEYFSAPTSSEPKEEAATEASAFNGTAKITVHVYGKTQQIECDDKTTVLKACMKNGIDPPYSCTVGVCTTCRAKVTKGELHMLEREGLTDDEIAKGYVLTCQAVPRSSEIELSYE
ncbi:MAG: ferredoxin--NADP reductase [Bacteroidetes bacterium]|nr:ferredoxin--NADP reductase [Bacteroidota bacterium]